MRKNAYNGVTNEKAETFFVRPPCRGRHPDIGSGGSRLNLLLPRGMVVQGCEAMISRTVLINGERFEVFDFRETSLADPPRHLGGQVLSVVTFGRPRSLPVGSSVQDEADRGERVGIVDACNQRQDGWCIITAYMFAAPKMKETAT